MDGQLPGETVFTMYSNTASKIARHSVCSGMLISSSSGVMASYLVGSG